MSATPHYLRPSLRLATRLLRPPHAVRAQLASERLEQLMKEKREALEVLRLSVDPRPYRLSRLERHLEEIEAAIGTQGRRPPAS